eukprot:IDg3066t1
MLTTPPASPLSSDFAPPTPPKSVIWDIEMSRRITAPKNSSPTTESGDKEQLAKENSTVIHRTLPIAKVKIKIRRRGNRNERNIVAYRGTLVGLTQLQQGKLAYHNAINTRFQQTNQVVEH